MNEELQGAVEAHIRKRLAGHRPKKRHPEKDWADFTDAERKMADIWHMVYFHDAPADVQERWIQEELAEVMPHAETVWQENGQALPLDMQDWFKISMRWTAAKQDATTERMRRTVQLAPPDKKDRLVAMLAAYEKNQEDSRALYEQVGVYTSGRIPMERFQELFAPDNEQVTYPFATPYRQLQERFHAQLKQIEQTYS
jgi:hypothetical protein